MEPESSVCMYGNVPSIVIVFGAIDREVDICESVSVPLFVIVMVIVSV